MSTPSQSTITTLIRSANEIANFFKSYPDESAIASIAEHINLFWTPVMREQFLASAAQHQSELHPLVQQCVALIKRRRNEKSHKTL
jgi:formate dehydrogenase subunit delta